MDDKKTTPQKSFASSLLPPKPRIHLSFITEEEREKYRVPGYNYLGL